jgi:hypothetical protein
MSEHKPPLSEMKIKLNPYIEMFNKKKIENGP